MSLWLEKKKRKLPNWLMSEEVLVYKVPSLLKQCKIVILNHTLYYKFTKVEKYIYDITESFNLLATIEAYEYCDCDFEFLCNCGNKPPFLTTINSNKAVKTSKYHHILHCEHYQEYTTCIPSEIDKLQAGKIRVRRRLFK